MSEVFTLQSKQEDRDSEGEEDDMTCGDLGNGLGRRPGGVYEMEGLNVHTFRSRKGSGKIFSPLLLKRGEESDAAIFHYSKCNGLYDVSSKKPGISGITRCSRQNSSESNFDVSNEELRQQLREAIEEVEILKVELEASQRQLEGKEEALKILQNMTVFNKATSHTKAMLQKTEEQKRGLEKEINALRWEIEFDQERFKNIEEAWTEKCDRIYCENAALKETLKLRTDEVRTLKSENARLVMLQGNKKNLGQKLTGMLISDADCRKMEELDNPHEMLRMLIDLLSDKEEALAHQRKVSYMLARAMEEKEDASKQSNENNLSGENITLKNHQDTASESQESTDPEYSCCQNLGSQDNTFSIRNSKIYRKSARPLKKSHSWPSRNLKENYVQGTDETTDMNCTYQEHSELKNNLIVPRHK
uniref:Uncharacterized protein n=1 Tax=Gopherus agassizii TaxID=38772 RepID=A0A452J400_9SAUR